MTPRDAACRAAASAILLASVHRVSLLDLLDALSDGGAWDEYGGLAKTVADCLLDRQDALYRAVVEAACA